MDRELNLYSDPKEKTNKVAQVMVLSLSSQPVDHEENGRVKLRPGEVGESLFGSFFLFLSVAKGSLFILNIFQTLQSVLPF